MRCCRGVCIWVSLYFRVERAVFCAPDRGDTLMPPFGGPSPMSMGGAAPGMAMPKSPFGGPSGPGTSPALSPGQGAGHEAAAIADIKACIPTLLKSLNAFKIGDKRRLALQQAVTRLESNFGQSQDEDLTPAAAQRIGAAAKPGGGLAGHNMPPPGILLGGPSPMGAGGGAAAGGMG
jgi:hypothetical protein